MPNSRRFESLLAVFLLWLGWISGVTCAAEAPKFAVEQIEFFEKSVRPILSEHCVGCHGAKKQKGGLRLDSRATILAGGDSGPAVVPGNLKEGYLVDAVSYGEVFQMPPKGKLAPEKIADLKRWVKMGAPWPEELAPRQRPKSQEAAIVAERSDRWIYQPPKRPPAPPVNRADWVRSPIDAFILAGLERAALEPAPPTDKRTLLRRVTFDLIGLPPTSNEIATFQTDDSPGAFARVVDRLLASPHYGERWARHWLDLVRYAETSGHEFDFELPLAYRYRDYVIRALNVDVPYDRFVIEHVAGDLVSEPRRHPREGFDESILATGFFFLGESKHSPVDIREDEAARVDNQIDVFSKALLGLTLACARCHDHKFDAITQRDYYALAGFLQSSRYQEALIDPSAPRRRLADALDAFDSVHGAEIAAAALSDRFASLAADLSAHGERPKDQPESGPFAKRLRERARKDPDHPIHPWIVLCLDEKNADVEPFTKRRVGMVRRLKRRREEADHAGGSTLFEDFSASDFGAWFVTGEAFGHAPTSVNRWMVRSDPNRPVEGIAAGQAANAGSVSPRLEGAIRSPTFTIEKPHIWYRVAGRASKINLIIDGFQQIRNPLYGGLTVAVDHGPGFVWRVQDVGMWVGHKAYIEVLDGHDGYVSVDEVRFADRRRPRSAPNRLVLQMLDAARLYSPRDLADAYVDLLRTTFEKAARDPALLTDDEVQLVNAALNWNTRSNQATATLRARGKLEAAIPISRRAMALADGTPENERIHIRGNHKNLGNEVPRRLFEALTGTGDSLSNDGSGRLELARILTAPDNPLLARVMVNRLWQHHFGAGLVRSPDDFGVMGQEPTHPELLDWLATEFVRRDWSLKRMHRLMLLSSVYRMSSKSDAKTEELDPLNKHWHRMPIRRLDAEPIRDSILALSGRLDRSFQGPGIAPYLTDFMSGRGRPKRSGPLDGAGRRSIYINVRRNFLTPMFLAFDYPQPFSTVGRRSASNVPAQALTLLNNPFVLEQATLWADRAYSTPATIPAERVRSLYETAFGRLPTDGELRSALEFVAAQSEQGDDRKAWADLCHVLINVKEFIFVR